MAVAALLAIHLGGQAASIYHDRASFLADNPGITLVNFDETPDGAATMSGLLIEATYSALGVTFPAGNVFESQPFVDPVSTPMAWIYERVAQETPVLTATFTLPGVRAVGVHNIVGGGIPNGSLLEAFDNGDALLGSVLSDNDGQTMDFFGLTTSADIAKIKITVEGTPGFDWGWGLDDLYFGPPGVSDPNPAPIPDATSTVLLASMAGLSLIGLRRFLR